MTTSTLTPWSLVALMIVALACGADGEPANDGTGTGTSGTSTTDAGTSSAGATTTADPTAPATTGNADESGEAGDTSTTDAATCPAEALSPGQHDDIAIEHDGIMRSYNLYVPEGYDGTAATPLVLNFHGFTSNAEQQQLFSGMNPTADAHGFLLAYPQGLDQSWNAGACCGTSASSGVDDVGFALAVVADISSRACVDGKRVYATGMSNGGFLSHRLACEAADTFAAIAPVAGVIGVPMADCVPARPVPVMHFHGTLDPLVPYGGSLDFPSVADTMAHWADRDACAGDPVEVFAEADVHCEATSDCAGGVRTELCTIEAGGHCWPGTAFCPFGVSTVTISASERMAEFFAEYALP